LSADPSSPRPNAPDVFATTRWTQVVASNGDSPEGRQALSDLCAAYYAPIVAFLRREGREEDDARELAHEFFERLLERQSIGGADPRHGRFRTYLLGALKHFLSNRRTYQSREKRGAGSEHATLSNDTDAVPVLTEANASMPSPDAMFDREWALSVLEHAFAVMKQESEKAGTLREFELLKPWLTGKGAACTQVDAARQLGLNEGAVRVSIYRFRRRFRELVKAEIKQTVNNPSDVADELRLLIEALSL
jgi:RNA polymerase sigma factor (sigma-70 family)